MEVVDSVFLFEYSTCTSQFFPSGAAVEGLAMFNTFLSGFKNPLTFYNSNKYIDDFKEYLENSEYVLTIAPETDRELYNLTSLIEKSHCKNLGSTKKAVFVTSDKFLTFKRLKSLSPKTEIFKNTTSLDFPFIAKPRVGVSSEGVQLVKDEDGLSKIPAGYLVQEYIRGVPMSLSMLIGAKTQVLSINTQELTGFEYFGAKLPVKLLNPDYLDELVDLLQKIEGLNGYVGVDFILTDNGPVLIEINSRPSTPLIGFKDAYNMNVANVLLKNYNDLPLPETKVKRNIHIKKTRTLNDSRGEWEYSIKAVKYDENICV